MIQFLELIISQISNKLVTQINLSMSEVIPEKQLHPKNGSCEPTFRAIATMSILNTAGNFIFTKCYIRNIRLRFFRRKLHFIKNKFRPDLNCVSCK